MRAGHLPLMILLAGCGGEDEPEPRQTPWEKLAEPALAPEAPCTAADLPAQWISQTGCFDGAEPAAGLVPYEVRAPLWADRADKGRWVALPAGTRFEVDEIGRLELPVGGVAVKHFARDGVDLETRFISRGDDGLLRFHTYVWNAEGTDAERVVDGTWAGDWAVPTEQDCHTCHGDPGRALGLESRQLHGADDSELARWVAMGWVDPKALHPADIEPLARYEGEATVEERARSYLHANCASCHQPTGSAFTDIDLRIFAPLRLTGTCDRVAETWAVGGANILIEPGSPETSVLYLRMETTSALDRMPSMGSFEPDPIGVPLVADWIRDIEDCD